MDHVKRSLSSTAEHFVGVVGHMPGMTSVELLEGGSGSVTIRTNEGLMRRTNITTMVDNERVVVEFDELYEAGSKVKTTSHFVDEFTVGGAGVIYRIVVSDVESPGLLGFLYRKFGRSKMGSAFLSSTKRFLESSP